MQASIFDVEYTIYMEFPLKLFIMQQKLYFASNSFSHFTNSQYWNCEIHTHTMLMVCLLAHAIDRMVKIQSFIMAIEHFSGCMSRIARKIHPHMRICAQWNVSLHAIGRTNKEFEQETNEFHWNLYRIIGIINVLKLFSYHSRNSTIQYRLSAIYFEFFFYVISKHSERERCNTVW